MIIGICRELSNLIFLNFMNSLIIIFKIKIDESKFKSEEIEVNIIKENPKDKKHSQSYSSKLLILQEYYDKMSKY